VIQTCLISFALATVVLATGAHALTPLPPCNVEEGGMRVYDATPFGHSESGFVFESYHSLDTADGRIAGADGPVPALNQFIGIRITECRTGKFIAVNGAPGNNSAAPMLATEFLRTRAQQQDPFRFVDVKRAAKALFGKDGFTQMSVLRETEETCGCNVLFPGVWK
jgi:hypothetical protein